MSSHPHENKKASSPWPSIIIASLILILGGLAAFRSVSAAKADKTAAEAPAEPEYVSSEAQPEASVPEEPSVPAAPEPTEAPAPEETAAPEEPETPAARAAALGLPEPPDVDITSWEFVLCNSYNSISGYLCEGPAGFLGQGIDARISEQAMALISAAVDAGYQCYLTAGYRDYFFLSEKWHEIVKLNYDGSAYEAAQHILPPGCNDHQTGLGIDLTDNAYYSFNYDMENDPDAANSELFSWLCQHCAEYGFIQRYPEGKEAYYGTACCPNHFRYVGTEAASYIMENHLCLEEFLDLYGVERFEAPDYLAGN